MTRPIRVAISGAAGRIGYSLVFRIASGGLFGNQQRVSLGLLEQPEAVRRLGGCAMELKDCAFPLLDRVDHGSDPREIFAGADWIILLGGRPATPEVHDRIDMLRVNGPIMVAHGRAIDQVSPTARVLVVPFPSNTNCLIALSQAMNMPRERWFALNPLVRARTTAMIAEKLGTTVCQVNRLTIWGNNSTSAYIDLHNARVGDVPVLQRIGDPAWVRETLERAVGCRSMEILNLAGGGPAGSIAHSILTTIRAIVTPTPFEHWFSVSVPVPRNPYGVPRGLVFGLPLVTPDGSTWHVSPNHYLDEHARERIAANVAELEHEASAVGHLLGTL